MGGVLRDIPVQRVQYRLVDGFEVCDFLEEIPAIVALWCIGKVGERGATTG
jgi:hypothetical protein